MNIRRFDRELIAFILGAIGFFGYAPFNIAIIGFICFAGFIFLIADQSPRRSLRIGFIWGISYFLFGIHWIYVSVQQFGGVPNYLSALLVLLAASYLAIYPLLFSYLIRRLNKYAPPFSLRQLLLLIPITWAFTEYLRLHIMGGLTWLEFGYTQLSLPSRSLFPIIGIDGVNLIFTLFCGLLIYFIHHFYALFMHFSAKNQNKTEPFSLAFVRNRSIYPLCMIILFIFLVFGLNFIQWTHKDLNRSQSIALVQGNIEQSLKWDDDSLESTKLRYLNAVIKQSKTHDLVILPEAAIPDIEIAQQDYLTDLQTIASNTNSSIALGIIDYRPSKIKPTIYNTLVVLDPKQSYFYGNANRYNKNHLVPFGEFTPLAWLIKPISDLLNIPMSDLTEGNDIQAPIIMNNRKLLAAICYEIVLTERILDNFSPDVDYLLTISNDAWFGDTIGPWQHIQMAQARALEFGRPLIRSTNTGITAIIDEHGNIQSQIPQFEYRTLSDIVYSVNGQTLYSAIGKKGYYCLLTLLFILFIALNLRKKQQYL